MSILSRGNGLTIARIPVHFSKILRRSGTSSVCPMQSSSDSGPDRTQGLGSRSRLQSDYKPLLERGFSAFLQSARSKTKTIASSEMLDGICYSSHVTYHSIYLTIP